MAEPAPKADGGHVANEDTVQQQPSGSLQTAEVDVGTAKQQAENTDTPAAQSSSAPAAAEGTPQAKETDKTEPPAPPPAADKPPREDDSLSIGPSDLPPPALAATSNNDAPVCAITLLLPTGARHPYRIDEKYLAKRNVEVPDVTESGKRDPFSISVYKLKELILREWREEWEGKPASPSSIRLIHFGKLLDDKEQLKSELPTPRYRCVEC